MSAAHVTKDFGVVRSSMRAHGKAALVGRLGDYHSYEIFGKYPPIPSMRLLTGWGKPSPRYELNQIHLVSQAQEGL